METAEGRGTMIGLKRRRMTRTNSMLVANRAGKIVPLTLKSPTVEELRQQAQVMAKEGTR